MSAKPKAAFLDFATLGPHVDTKALEALVDVRYHDCSDLFDVAPRLADCEIAIVNKSKVDADAIREAKRLKLIALAATGSDNVDVTTARERGVAVASTRDYCSTSLAQHVFALVLGLTQQIGRYDALVRRGVRQESRTFALFDYPIRELAGRTLGIVGSGALGQAVARLGQCFGMHVAIAARLGTPRDQVPPDPVHFEDLLEQADVLSLHCPLNATTKHMIGAPQLLAPDIPNLIVTPHIAWAAQEARQRALDQVTENIADFLRGGSLRRIV